MRRLRALVVLLAVLPLDAAEPLTLLPAASDATAASDRWSDWDLAALPAGEPSDGWRGGTIVRPADGLAALVLAGKQAVSTSRHHTVTIDPGEPVELEVAWSGGAGQVHAAHYALGTWGNTVAEDRFPLPAGADVQRRGWTLTPRPGALSLGVWITRQGEAPLQLQQVRLRGRPWGGVAYPAQATPAWQVWELAGGTVPVNSQHAGPGSRVTALRCRGGGGAEETPWIPAGALLPATAGACRVALEAVEPGGGPVVRQWAGDLADGTGRVVLPGIDCSLDLRAWAWDAAGTLVRQSSLRLRLIPRAPVDAPAGWAGTPAVVPLHPGGALTIALTGARVRPLPTDGMITGTIAVEPGPVARMLTVVATRHDRQVVLQSEQLIPAAGELVPVTIPADRPDTYLLRAELRQDGRLVDASELKLGCNDTRPPAAAVPAPLPRPLLVEEQVFPARRNAPAVDRLFGDYVNDCTANGSTVIGIGVNLADLAPLPGHHRFDDLDARVARVTAAGRAASIFLILHYDAWPGWAPWEPPLDQDGRPDPAVAASAASAGMRQVVAAAWQAIALHYRGEPAVVGYTCWNPFFDWTWHDSPEHRYDHCASARSAWAAFAGGQPAPAWAAEGPDLSSAWRRWAAFRDHLAGLWHLDGFARAVRAVDPHRRLWVYEAAGGHGATETRWDEYRRLGVQPAHGGGEPRDMVSHIQLAAAHGLGWRHESVAAPARHPIANDLLVFHALFGGLDQAWNTAWNCNWTNTHAQPGIASARQRLRQLATVVDALQAEGYAPAPTTWTQFLGWDGAALNRRTFQWHGLEADLLLGHMSDSLSGTAISDHTPVSLWPHGGLVVANHLAVITPESAAALRRHAEQGGTVALHLGPGPGLAAVAEIFGFSVTGPATAARVAAQGLPPLFPTDRRVVVLKPVPVRAPADALPCLVAADGSPLAWRLACGQGTAVVTSGAIDALASRGWLDDLARSAGGQRRFQLTAGAGDGHPPEGLLFTRADGGAVLALHRAIRWNLHGRMIDQAAAAPPTIAGFASIHLPKPVTVRWWAPQAGTWQVERWQDGAWLPLGPSTADALAGEGVTVAMTAGECVFLRFLPATR